MARHGVCHNEALGAVATKPAQMEARAVAEVGLATQCWCVKRGLWHHYKAAGDMPEVTEMPRPVHENNSNNVTHVMAMKLS